MSELLTPDQLSLDEFLNQNPEYICIPATARDRQFLTRNDKVPKDTRYIISTKTLAGGSFGAIYNVFDCLLGKALVAKEIRNYSKGSGQMLQNIEDLKSEAINLAKLEHINIVKVYGIVDFKDDRFSSPYDERVVVIMEKVEEGSLDNYDHSELSQNDIKFIADSLCAGIKCIHKSGQIHLDLKPSNVIYDGSEICKIIDFGNLRKITHDGSDIPNAATPFYSAPELLLDLRASVCSDVYSLGQIIYELISGGKKAFDRELTPFGLQVKKKIGEVLIYEDVKEKYPNTLKVLLKAMDADDFQRYNSIEEFQNAFNQAWAQDLQQQVQRIQQDG